MVVDAPVLVVSPHYDDALLSAYVLSVNPRATVLTVFTNGPSPAIVTEWDSRCGFADSDDAMTTRAAEDEAAFAGLETVRETLGLVEAQYRSGPREDADSEALVAFVNQWVDRHGGSVALPVGAGRELTAMHWLRFHIPILGIGMPGGAPPHPDHRWVTDTLINRLAGSPVILYEDLPYAWALRGDRRAAELALLRRAEARRIETPVSPAEKSRRVNAYQSQVGGIVAGWVDDLSSVLPAVETSWQLALPSS